MAVNERSDRIFQLRDLGDELMVPRLVTTGKAKSLGTTQLP